MQMLATYKKAIEGYQATLADLRGKGGSTEQHLRPAFQHLLATVGRKVEWTLVPEQRLPNGRVPDGTLRDAFLLPRGYWEAKDTADDLDTEIKKKIALGYPLTNTIFEDTHRAVLFQNGQPALETDLTDARQVADLLQAFTTHAEPSIEHFEQAVAEFKARIPELAAGVLAIIARERAENKKFVTAFGAFHLMCKTALDPRITVTQIDEMLVQHLLTERLFRTVFDNPDFTRRNAIAAEIERVIDALTSRAFNRGAFLKSLDRFYVAIEDTARGLADFAEKQHFLNVVYERFFQGFSVKTADTMGIVYTPQEIVDFMCASVDEVLKQEFGKSLSTPGVMILDPCVGTGNFIVNILRRLNRRDLPRKYAEDLFCNEIMLLPYYIASMNIEHAYFELTGEYAPFEGICFTDTLDLAEAHQLGLFSEENTARVQREKDAEITVIIGNPPYNAGQKNENDNNKNRKYPAIDQRIRETYVKDSKAKLKSKTYDAYLRFYRWATDRLQGRDGIVCFVSNNSFARKDSLDGTAKHLLRDFTYIFHVDLGGDSREGKGGNVFGIRPGVGITILVRHKKDTEEVNTAQVHLHAVEDKIKREEKLQALSQLNSFSNISWDCPSDPSAIPWLRPAGNPIFHTYTPLGQINPDKYSSRNRVFFGEYSLGVSTNRDAIVYDFSIKGLIERITTFIDAYNAEVTRWLVAGRPADIDNWVNYDSVKWSEHLKHELKRGKLGKVEPDAIRSTLYRPFCTKYLYYSGLIVDRPGHFPTFLPVTCEEENVVICVPGSGNRAGFGCIATQLLPSLDIAFEKSQCFPFYTYNEDGSNRRENITDWALGEFRALYGDGVTKWDIFHYVYALLHHPAYRARYAENLKRELPRIPLAVAPGDFPTYVEIGRTLADLHLHYETAPEYPLTWIENNKIPFSWRVEKMALTREKDAVVVNASLTLAGIPEAAHAYRLGNRSALEWVIDQYRVSTDARSGIVSDPNRPDDPEYIARLIGRVVTVSVETVRLVRALPDPGLPPD